MWLECINKKISEKGLTYKQIAAESYLTEKTVKRILTGTSKDPSLASIIAIVKVVGCSLDELFEIFVGTGAVVGSDSFIKLQQECSALKEENSRLNQELVNSQLQINNSMLEIKYLKNEIELKNEIILIHKTYLDYLGKTKKENNNEV